MKIELRGTLWTKPKTGARIFLPLLMPDGHVFPVQCALWLIFVVLVQRNINFNALKLVVCAHNKSVRGIALMPWVGSQVALMNHYDKTWLHDLPLNYVCLNSILVVMIFFFENTRWVACAAWHKQHVMAKYCQGSFIMMPFQCNSNSFFFTTP